MSVLNTLRKAFMGGYWTVLYRGREDAEFREVRTPENIWVADPFVYEVEGQSYLFTEVFLKDKNKGAIGYFRFIEGEPIYQGIAIEQPYHMSYPCIFHHKGTFYMIPETSANKSIEMYRAERFPDKWVIDTVLQKGEKCVDTTVRFYGETPQLFTYRMTNGEWKLIQYNLDMSQKKLEFISETRYRSNCGRPAGFFFGNEKKLRPAQNCSRMYGEEIIVYTVDSVSPYREHENYRIQISDIGTDRKYNRIHTINSNEIYEVVDVRKDKFDLLHGVKTLMRVYAKG